MLPAVSVLPVIIKREGKGQALPESLAGDFPAGETEKLPIRWSNARRL